PFSVTFTHIFRIIHPPPIAFERTGMPTSPPKEGLPMAYREVRMMDIDQVIRRWLASEKIRAIARSTGLDRNTVRRMVRLAEEAGIRRDIPWPDEGKLQTIRQQMGRPGAAVAAGAAEQRLKPRTDQIRAWLEKDHLLLTKGHELLGPGGGVVSL